MAQHLSVSYTGPAKTQLQVLVNSDPQTFPTVVVAQQWHDTLINSFAGHEPALATANKARVRYGADDLHITFRLTGFW
jgi:hypothetical protein